MKQIIIYVCALFASLTFFSCSQDEEIYSCDKGINDWVKENLIDIQQMDRNDWLQLDESVSRAAYAAFTPEQKFLFWKEKITEVLALDWNEQEKQHIDLLYETISNNPQWFATDFRKNEEELEMLELFEYKWIENAKDILGWDMIIIGAIAASGNKMLNTKGELQIKSTIRLKDRSEGSCNCNTYWYAGESCGTSGGKYMYCSTSPKTCVKPLKDNCGFFLNKPCNGLCQ